MTQLNGKKLVIVGAGPKAMAIASKNAVLASLGFSVPEVHIVERRSVGANWTGDFGYTNGRLRLGTSPEKDVGFPYQSRSWGSLSAEVNRRMGAFSWQSFLIENERYSDWVDKGRPAPQHRDWAMYLQWVARSVGEGIRFHHGEVSQVRLSDGRWQIAYDTAGEGRHTLEGDGIVITGPGKIKLQDRLPVHDRVLTVESFWKTYRQFRDMRGIRLAIVGSGENAASIAMALVECGSPNIAIDILCPSGMAFSRGESFRENRVYSDPDQGKWDRLGQEDRRQFIYRTDRGVFSQYAQRVLDLADNIEILPGRMAEVTPRESKLEISLEYQGTGERRDYDYVVLATGSDQLSFFRDLLDAASSDEITARIGIPALREALVERHIDRALSVNGLQPRLHLPMLSGMTQGPGFSNLSCLGRLSDRVLQAYVQGGHG